MERRRYLALLVAGVAGCSDQRQSGDPDATVGSTRSTVTTTAIPPTRREETITGTTRSGPAFFEDVELAGPDQVAVNEEFYLEISVSNTGGESGTYSDALSGTIGDFSLSDDRSFEVEDVEAGTRSTKRLGPYESHVSGSYEFQVADFDAETQVDVSTLVLDESEAFVGDLLKTEIAEMSVQQSFSYRYNPMFGDPTTSLFASASGKVFLIVDLTVQKQSTEDGTIPRRSDILVESGETIYEPLEVEKTPESMTAWQGGDDISSGASRSGVLVYHVELVEGAAVPQLLWRRDDDDSADIAWELSQTRSRLSDPPQFQIATADVPDSVEISTEATVQYTIENTGSAGTFRGVLQRRNVGERSWTSLERPEMELDSGESTAWSTSISEPYLGPSEYRLFPFSETQTVDFTAATRSVGERFGASNVDYLVDDIRLSDSITHEGYSEETIEAGSGQQFVMVHIQARGTGDPTVDVWNEESFEVLVDNESYTFYQPTLLDDLTEPVSGPYYDPITISAGESVVGWVLFKILASATRSDLGVRGGGHSQAAIWS